MPLLQQLRSPFGNHFDDHHHGDGGGGPSGGHLHPDDPGPGALLPEEGRSPPLPPGLRPLPGQVPHLGQGRPQVSLARLERRIGLGYSRPSFPETCPGHLNKYFETVSLHLETRIYKHIF